jgi:hypothetical protein
MLKISFPKVVKSAWRCVAMAVVVVVSEVRGDAKLTRAFLDVKRQIPIASSSVIVALSPSCARKFIVSLNLPNQIHFLSQFSLYVTHSRVSYDSPTQ